MRDFLSILAALGIAAFLLMMVMGIVGASLKFWIDLFS